MLLSSLGPLPPTVSSPSSASNCLVTFQGEGGLAGGFDLSCRCVDDLISFNSGGFGEFVSGVCPGGLAVSGAAESASVASCLDLLFTRDRGNNMAAELCDRRGAFGFRVVGFPFVSGSVPSAPACGVCASRLVRCARCCSGCSGFLVRRGALVGGLLSRGCGVGRLSGTFGGFCGRHAGLVGRCGRGVCQMFAGSIGWGDFFFFFFVLVDLRVAELVELAGVAGVVRGAGRACSIRSTWWLHRLAAGVPFVACVINLPCTFGRCLDMSGL